MTIDPTKEILNEEQIDLMVCGVIALLLEGVFEQLGTPLQVLGHIFKDMRDENVVAASTNLKAKLEEWKTKSDKISELLKVES